MRGTDVPQSGMFSYVALESRVPAGHPLRAVRRLLDEALADLNRDFDRVYAQDGRASIPPERLVRALMPRDNQGDSGPTIKMRILPGARGIRA